MAPAGSKRGTSDRGDSSSDEGAARSAKGTRRPGHARDGEQRRKKQYERRERVNGPTEPIGADDADQGLVPKYPNRAAQPGGNCAGPVPDGAAENKEQQQLQKITKLIRDPTPPPEPATPFLETNDYLALTYARSVYDKKKAEAQALRQLITRTEATKTVVNKLDDVLYAYKTEVKTLKATLRSEQSSHERIVESRQAQHEEALEDQKTRLTQEIKTRDEEIKKKDELLKAKQRGQVNEGDLKPNCSEPKAKESTVQNESKAMEGELKKKDELLKTKEAEVKTSKQQLDMMDVQLKAKITQVKAKDLEIQGKAGEIKAKRTEVNTKDVQLKAKDAELKAKDRELKAMDGEKEALKKLLAGKDHEIALLKGGENGS